MRTIHRTDKKKQEIVNDLIQHGATILDLNNTTTAGCPDICVGIFGNNYLLEIKDNKKSKLRESQIIFRNNWKGQYTVVYSVEDAREACGIKHSNK